MNPKLAHITPPSYWPIMGSFALFFLALGIVQALHQGVWAPYLALLGFLLLIYTLYGWFAEVIGENMAGLGERPQVKAAYRLAMLWFIFSEVMFFATLFAVLFYVRLFIIPWLSGQIEEGLLTHYLVWPHFDGQWPLLGNPDPSGFLGPKGTIHAWAIPFLNTLILLTSGITITVAHFAILHERRQLGLISQCLTILLGIVFLCLQAHEYIEAYNHYDLTLSSGIYGSLFFMLTGFHGLHVTLGTIMLMVIAWRMYLGHMTAHYHFAFEAVAWYWHFVDVVWLILFVFVYWI